jgi:beta-lactamase class A
MKNPAVIWLPILLGASIIANIVLAVQVARPVATDTENGQYPFIARRLFLEDPNDVLINFSPLRDDLRTYLAGLSDRTGVYFEYLPTGLSINAQGNDEFFRASLAKLPAVMRAYKFLEEERLSFDETLTLTEEQLDDGYGDLWQRGAGATLTVREAVTLILTHSDNTAFNALHERVNVQLLQDQPDGDQSIDDVYDYLDIPRAAEGVTPMISPKNYSSILKSLFFSAYLTYEHSNDILETLTGRLTEQWLRGPIPASIRVANKIGVYDVEPETLHVYADCGIVYYPSRPYILCIMVNSSDGEHSSTIIEDVSRMVYQYVDALP